MRQAIHRKVKIQKGGVIHFKDPALPTGGSAEVIVRFDDVKRILPPLRSFWGAGRGLFAGPEEVDDYIRNERESWH